MLNRILTLAALAIAAAPAAAQAPSAQAPQTMSKAELSSAIAARFVVIDTNKDGFLAKDEIAAVQAKALSSAQAVRQERMEAEFKKLDSNNNGAISFDEFKAAVPTVRASETPDEMLAGYDSDKDGRVSAAEYSARPIANFDRADANRDGILTQQEVTAATANP